MPKKLTHKEFVTRIANISPNILILGEYSSMKEHVKVRCKLCGYEWCPVADSLSHGYGCPRCQAVAFGNRLRMTQKSFVKKLLTVNPNIEILSEYKNNKTKVDCRCKIDGYVWSARPNNLLSSNTGCPKCAYYRNRTHEDFVKRMANVNTDIIICGKYTRMSDRILVKCKVCGHKWNPTALKLIQGRGCPVCCESKGEKSIRAWLNERNFYFESQKNFDNLVGLCGKPLSYDFYIPHSNMLIEYQGEQHERPIDFNGFGKEYAKEQFKKQLEHDKRKREYAESHHIELLEIWYTSFDNIAKILADKLGDK